jgi:hypothetical protein
MGGPATEAYKEHIKRLSTRIVEAQRPIRVLDATTTARCCISSSSCFR